MNGVSVIVKVAIDLARYFKEYQIDNIEAAHNIVKKTKKETPIIADVSLPESNLKAT
jgi:hypothetical protein